uniref:Uncharacterized protein n=1 Tax=Timema tahoe TaxID=61484 RepID=A0A7R9NWL7_9NEOP|nr:unnamed protein product [Timema tahoe]
MNTTEESVVDEASPAWVITLLVPVGTTLMLAALVFMLLLYRHCPYAVSAFVAVGLASVLLYLMLLTFKDSWPLYE